MMCRCQDCACFDFHGVKCGRRPGRRQRGSSGWGRWGMPCGGVTLGAGGALTGSTSMAVGGGGGGGAEDGGVEVVTGRAVATGVGKETGGELKGRNF